MLLIDGHLDLAYNAIGPRARPAAARRRDPPARGRAAMRRRPGGMHHVAARDAGRGHRGGGDVAAGPLQAVGEARPNPGAAVGRLAHPRDGPRRRPHAPRLLRAARTAGPRHHPPHPRRPRPSTAAVARGRDPMHRLRSPAGGADPHDGGRRPDRRPAATAAVARPRPADPIAHPLRPRPLRRGQPLRRPPPPEPPPGTGTTSTGP